MSISFFICPSDRVQFFEISFIIKSKKKQLSDNYKYCWFLVFGFWLLVVYKIKQSVRHCNGYLYANDTDLMSALLIFCIGQYYSSPHIAHPRNGRSEISIDDKEMPNNKLRLFHYDYLKLCRHAFLLYFFFFVIPGSLKSSFIVWNHL